MPFAASRRLVALGALLGPLVAVLACDAILGNQLGHYVGAEAGDDVSLAFEASGHSDSSAPLDASDAAEATPLVDAPQPETGEAAPPFSPADFGVTLVLWLEGDVGVTTATCPLGQCVTRWADQSTWGNDAVLPEAGTPPTLSSTGGHGAVSFDDFDGGTITSLDVADTSSIEFKSFSLVAVATDRANVSPHDGVLLTKQISTSSPYYGPGFFLNCSNGGLTSAMGRACVQIDITQFVASSELGLFDGVARSYVAVYDVSSTTLSLGVNDDPWANALVNNENITAKGFPLRIGGSGYARQTMTGDIAEMIALDTPMTTSQWTGLYGYLRTKYGLP